MHRGESAQRAAQRELAEELGLKVEAAEMGKPWVLTERSARGMNTVWIFAVELTEQPTLEVDGLTVQTRPRSRKLTHLLRMPNTAISDRHQTDIRMPFLVLSSGMDLRKLISARSIAADKLWGTENEQSHQPQPMLAGKVRVPVTQFEFALLWWGSIGSWLTAVARNETFDRYLPICENCSAVKSLNCLNSTRPSSGTESRIFRIYL